MNPGEEVAYLAGFFDGEGSIGIYPKKNKRGYMCYQYLLQISNTNRKVLELFQKRYGGSITKRQRVERHKQLWNWQLGSAGKIRVALSELLPFLYVKKQEAQIMLEVVATIKRTCYGRPVPATMMQFRLECADKLKELKRELVM